MRAQGVKDPPVTLEKDPQCKACPASHQLLHSLHASASSYHSAACIFLITFLRVWSKIFKTTMKTLVNQESN